jgi:hypothetical protein
MHKILNHCSSMALRAGASPSVTDFESAQNSSWAAARLFSILLIAFAFVVGSAQGSERTQEFQLAVGWNAIYLDVDPANEAVEAAFTSPLVDMVARYFVPETAVRFIEDSAEEPWNTAGWAVWYSPQRAESFLNSLHAVYGGAAYLVHAVKAGTLSVKGESKLRPAEWKVDSFNLTGFPVEALGLSFAEYFAGAENRIGSRVYRLNNGSWQKVTNLAATQIRPGEACWVYCDGSTSYPGPLEVRMPGSTSIQFNDRTSVVTVELRNRINTPFTVQVSIEENDGLPLYRQVVNLADLSVESSKLSSSISLGTLTPGSTTSLRLELRHEFLNGSSTSAILKFVTSNGVVTRVPIFYRAD